MDDVLSFVHAASASRGVSTKWLSRGNSTSPKHPILRRSPRSLPKSSALLYLTARIQRFGVYATDEIALTTEPFDTHHLLGREENAGIHEVERVDR